MTSYIFNQYIKYTAECSSLGDVYNFDLFGTVTGFVTINETFFSLTKINNCIRNAIFE